MRVFVITNTSLHLDVGVVETSLAIRFHPSERGRQDEHLPRFQTDRLARERPLDMGQPLDEGTEVVGGVKRATLAIREPGIEAIRTCFATESDEIIQLPPAGELHPMAGRDVACHHGSGVMSSHGRMGTWGAHQLPTANVVSRHALTLVTGWPRMYMYTPQRMMMTITRIFKNGNSQAVRIPAELAYERTDLELEIERIGDELRIRPARRRLDHLLEKFGQFSADFMANGRGENVEGDRDVL